MDKKIILFGFGILAAMVLVTWCVNQNQQPAETYNHSLTGLSVILSGTNYDNVSAVAEWGKTRTNPGTTNTAFINYFQAELDVISKRNSALKSIEIQKCSAFLSMNVSYCSLSITYQDVITDKEKSRFLDSLKSELESKWYVDTTAYESEIHGYGVYAS